MSTSDQLLQNQLYSQNAAAYARPHDKVKEIDSRPSLTGKDRIIDWYSGQWYYLSIYLVQLIAYISSIGTRSGFGVTGSIFSTHIGKSSPRSCSIDIMPSVRAIAAPYYIWVA